METRPPTPKQGSLWILQKIVTVLFLLFVFLVGVKGLGDGFKMLGEDLLGAVFRATSNPFVGLVVGILTTTLVQSSSVTTSMIVGLVAAPENPLPLANAVPMIMGANIGTTVTNTVVSLAHMGRKDEFLRAFSVATCHDFFNFFAVAILLPLEIFTGVLQKLAISVYSVIGHTGGVNYDSPLKSALKVALAPIHSAGEFLFSTESGRAALLIVASALLIFAALLLLVKVLRSAMQSKVETFVSRSLDASPLLGMTVGLLVTFVVQSSSITTSLLVPLAGAAIITLNQAFPITLGANIGTTLTALMASLAVSGPNAPAGVEIALVHLLFNLIGILLIYPIPSVRRLPLFASERLAGIAVRSRKWAIFYVVGLFYLLPGLLIFISNLFS